MGSRQYARWCRENGDDIVLMVTPETIGCYKEKPDRKPADSLCESVESFFERVFVNWKLGCPSGARHVAFLTDRDLYCATRDAQKLFERHSNVPVRVGRLSKIVTSFPCGSLLYRSQKKYEERARERDLVEPLGVVPTARWSDDASFWEYGYKAFAITDTAHLRYKHYHEKTVLPDKINFEGMTSVVEGMIGMVEEMAGQAR